MRAPTALAVVFIAVALAAPFHAGAQQTRDEVTRASGTATLTGIVVADDTGRPVERALVTVRGIAPAFAEVASTDAEGRFAVSGLPADDVTVTATKTTYLTAYYGGHDLVRGPAVPFTLSNGTARDITVRLARGAVIAGTVTGPTGRPQAGVRLSVRQSRVVGGTRRLVGGLRGQGSPTDDKGRYRIWGLPPGEYVVGATPDEAATGVQTTSDADVQWAMAIANGARTPTPPSAVQVVRFAPVYYPAAIDAAQAAPVAVDAGGERDGVDIALQAIATSGLRGTVVALDGQPAADVLVSLDGALEHETASSDSGGRFEFHDVSPGMHQLSGRGRRSVGGPAADSPWASLDVVVNGQDQTGLVLGLRPGMTASGRVSFQGQSAPGASRATIALTVSDNLAGSAMPAQAESAADGTFTIAGLAPGRYQVHAAATIPPTTSSASGVWLLRSVLFQDQDLLDGTLDIVPGQDVSGLAVVFSDRQTDLRGTFFDSTGRPIAGYDVVVFAADRRFWTPESRRVEHVLLGRDGRFDFSNLPPGEYLLAAVTHADADDLADASWLDAVAAMAIHTTLAEGEHKVQDIRLGHSS